ncbi:phage shock protein A (PspA) family protein [Desulfotomaculum arcticum]|uniref:Phage shock protein A (PspA) family protein n=1 Tax=Desulfotruncus arcticus DSM 17038 TaxID=1121424 RepID=A0A1I2REJ2_9FIRM|nr:PspA/IM30 family protein [Desulfotruncus arcticus]SFG38473.1 phage shock protein A (PspA) family protein [Desulfotomaculum arcticum] [Desulfotruncus arcticus DSM 17038]
MVFKRIRDLTLATIHDGLDAMESPVSMLNQYLRDLEDEIEKAQEAVVKQIMIEKKFNEYQNDAKHMAEKRMRQATLAVGAGAEELARRALRDKKQYAAKAEQYEEMGTEAHQKVLELKEQLKEMKEKYYQLRDRKIELISRANAAKTKKQMNAVLSKFDSESALKGFKRMEERIMEWETEAEVRRVGPQDTYVQQLAALEPDEEVEKELAALKAGNAARDQSDITGVNDFVLQKEKTQA